MGFSAPAIPPYSESDWQREWDDGQKLPCPRCASPEDCGPRLAVLPDRSFRRYRACKRCGLCQEADGVSAPYHTIAVAHECLPASGADAQCRSCGKRPRKGGGHLCARILRELLPFNCAECGTRIGEQHVLPWAEPGPWR